MLIVAENGNCDRVDLNKSDVYLTPFYGVKGTDGKTRIQSQLYSVLESKEQLSYVGNDTVRGIPVENYQMCVLSSDKTQTIRYTLSMTNGTSWTPAAPFTGEYVIPVQLKADKKFSTNPFVENDILSIHEFRPSLSLTEEGYFVSFLFV